jgi:polyferredoxin
MIFSNGSPFLFLCKSCFKSLFYSSRSSTFHLTVVTTMQTVRRISQVFFILLYIFFFLKNAFPLEPALPVFFFLRTDALAMLSAALAGRFFLIQFFPVLLILVITAVFGRFFCGWFCPLGSTFDGWDSAARIKPGNRNNSNGYRFRWVKVAVLMVILVAALFSLDLAGWLAPVPLFTRTVTTVFYPLFTAIITGLLDIIRSLPFLETPVGQFQRWLTPNLLSVTQTVFRGVWVTGVMFLSLILLSFVNRRFWCRNLCPLGALLSMTSLLRVYRRRVSDQCTECGRCHEFCRMGAIPENPFDTVHTECINCMDCQKICPVGAISFDLKGRPRPETVDITRRRIMGAGLAGLVSVGFARIGFIRSADRDKIVRPPGALAENEFLDRCIRCGACIRACSTSGKGLQFTGMESGFGGLATPRLITPEGYCRYGCHLCGQVCPTGAIPALPLERKQATKMGTAHFDKTRCIPWYTGETCLVCEAFCPVPGKAIKLVESDVRTIDGRESRVPLPYVEEFRCVGCGLCTVVCPVSGDKGIFLTNKGQMRG